MNFWLANGYSEIQCTATNMLYKHQVNNYLWYTSIGFALSGMESQICFPQCNIQNRWKCFASKNNKAYQMTNLNYKEWVIESSGYQRYKSSQHQGKNGQSIILVHR